MFLLKKIAGALLSPLPLCLFVTLCGYLLLCYTQRLKTAKFLIIVGIASLALFSLTPVSNTLLISLEGQYPPYLQHPTHNTRQIKYIVVPGGGHITDPAVPVTSQINATTLARLIEGIRLYKMTPGSRLILSGGKIFNDKPEAETMRAIAELMGIESSAIILDSESRDTEMQAVNLKKLVKEDEFILVTSASHMPRSMALFTRQGMSPTPAPANHGVRQQTTLTPHYFIPNAAALRNSERAIHEYLGLLWAQLRGEI